MELQRILAKDTRSAMEQIHTLYGSDALVVSNKKAKGKTEVIVAIEIAAEAQTMLNDLQVPRQESPIPSPTMGADFQQIMESKVFTPSVTAIEQSSVLDTTIVVKDNIQNRPQDDNKDYLKARELVDLVKLELHAMRRELKISQQIDAQSTTIDGVPHLASLKEALQSTGMPAPLRILVNDIIADNENVPSAIKTISSTFGNAINHLNVIDDMRGVHIIAGRLGIENSVMAMRLARQKAATYGANNVAVISFTDNQSDNWSQTQLFGLNSGIETYRASTPAMLMEKLSQLSSYELVIIETTGLELEVNLTTFAKLIPHAKQHLVISADASEISTNRYLTNEALNWSSVMLSQLESDVFPWAVINALMASPVPVSLASSSSSVTKEATSVNGFSLTENALLNLPMSTI
jgi:flagellar biosynthesis protein FlhF